MDIDGRGNTPKEAVQNMWERIKPLEGKGYHPVSSVELVDVKTNKIVDSFQLNDPAWAYVKTRDEASKGSTKQEHRPPTQHEFKFKARVKLEL